MSPGTHDLRIGLLDGPVLLDQRTLSITVTADMSALTYGVIGVLCVAVLAPIVTIRRQRRVGL